MMYKLVIAFDDDVVIIKTSKIYIINHYLHECSKYGIKTYTLKEIKK